MSGDHETDRQTNKSTKRFHLKKVISLTRRRVRHAMTFAFVLLTSAPAFAQNLESKVQNLGNLVVNILTVVATLVGIAACLLAGMKYMGGDPHAREQVKGIAIGAFFCFGAAAIVQAMRGALT